MVRKRPSSVNDLRKKAESRVRNKGSGGKNGPENHDHAKLLHELNVHHEELELQNEELRMQRDKADEAIHKYSDLYTEIYDFTPVAYFSFSREGTILELNRKAYELLGAERSFLIGRNFGFFLTMDSRKIFADFLSEIFGQKKRKRCEIQVLQNRSVVYAILEGTVSEKEDKCLAMVLDITDRKMLELELEEARNTLTLALENGKIGLWQWDIAEDIMTWDQRMEEMFGITPGTFDGKPSTFESLIHEDDLPQLRILTDRALASGISMEAVYRTKEINARSSYIMSKAVVTRDGMNRPLNVTGVCFDVTSIQEGAEKHIVKLNEELLKSNEELRQFAYVASHDLQEPLRMVTSFTQLLQLQYKDKLDEKANEYISFAVEGSKRMYELLNGLLAYSRVQTRGTEFIVVSMGTIVHKVLANLRLLIDETQVKISVGKLPVIRADDSQMIQLMQNLIENSIKFCKRKPSIKISCRNDDGMWVFSVQDNGIGIEPQYFDKIFMIFQRLHLKEEYKGTGIGLALCRKIVERHGGKMWVESVSGIGSTFSFSIPGKL
ncbi:MAG TPA: ATP-binding protein [Bacteroidales bacterium]|nr:ATP-binding protein [Bacteroidales bacterium]